MSQVTEITSDFAKRVVLQAQLLDGIAKLKKGKEGVKQIINRLGYVQIDSLTVIKRAHHHVLWTRLPNYNEQMLQELHAQDRYVFEYWGHALSYIPISDYPFYIPRMNKFNQPKSGWALEFLKRGGHLMPQLIEIIGKEGPKHTSALMDILEQTHGSNFSREAVKAALNLLFWKGDLMVSQRKNFKKIYDLTGRILPRSISKKIPTEEELAVFLIKRALEAFGIAREREIGLFLQPESTRDSHFQAVNKQVISGVIKKLIRAGDVVEVKIKDDISTEYFSLPSKLEAANEPEASSKNLFLLSPFDNLLIQREWIKHLFGFEYALECYLPASKRKYGYFVLPILWGDQFIGRLDPKADNKSQTFIIKNLTFEPKFTSFGELLPELATKIIDLAVFNECKHILVEQVSPSRMKPILERLLK
jgi:uncharacterized protein YcaQ